MSIPDHIIQMMNEMTEIKGKPHRHLTHDGFEDTGCFVWANKPFHHEIFLELVARMDDDLRETYKKASLSQDPLFWEKQNTEIQEKWKNHISYSQEFTERIQNQPVVQLPPIRRVRERLQAEALIAYEYDKAIVIAPIVDQFDILRIENTFASNRNLGTEEIISSLKYLDEWFGINILGATDASVNFKLKRAPSKDEKKKLKKFIYELCPEIEGELSRFTNSTISLWWD